MPRYIVSYDLRKEVSSTDWYRLYMALKGAVDYCWPLQSIWVIETPRTPSEIIQFLLDGGVIDDNDGVIVLEITGVGGYRRVANKDVAAWLDSRIIKV